MTGQGRIDVAADELHPFPGLDCQIFRNKSNDTATFGTAINVDESSHIGHVIWIDRYARIELCVFQKMRGLVRCEEANDLSTYRSLI